MPKDINTEIDLTAWEGASWDVEKPTASIRFVSRNGKAILQQKWQIDGINRGSEFARHEWRDVEMIEAQPTA